MIDNNKIVNKYKAFGLCDYNTGVELDKLREAEKTNIKDVFDFINVEFGFEKHTVLEFKIGLCCLEYYEDAEKVGVKKDAAKLIKEVSSEIRIRDVFKLSEIYSRINKRILDMIKVPEVDLELVCLIITGYLSMNDKSYKGIRIENNREKILYNYDELDINVEDIKYIDYLNEKVVFKSGEEKSFDDIDRK